jgi:hypothetical protein
MSNRAVDKGIHATKNGEEQNKNRYPTKKNDGGLHIYMKGSGEKGTQNLWGSKI